MVLRRVSSAGVLLFIPRSRRGSGGAAIGVSNKRGEENSDPRSPTPNKPRRARRRRCKTMRRFFFVLFFPSRLASFLGAPGQWRHGERQRAAAGDLQLPGKSTYQSWFGRLFSVYVVRMSGLHASDRADCSRARSREMRRMTADFYGGVWIRNYVTLIGRHEAFTFLRDGVCIRATRCF